MTIKKRILSVIVISLIIMTMLSAVATLGPLFAHAASPTQAFGYTAVGSYTDRTPAGHKDSSRYQAPENGVINSVSMYIQTGNAQIRYGVYSDNNGKPDKLLGQSNLVTTTANSWVSAPLSVSVVAGQYYWLTITANSMVYWNCDFGGSAGNGFEPTANLAVTYGEFVPWGTAKFSMYATYTPTKNFGYETIGSYTDRTPAGHKDSSRYQAPENGVINSVSMYIQTGNAQIRYGVYSDNNGKPDKLLGQSNLVTTTANSWVSAPLSVSVVAGQYYWLTITANSMVYWNCDFGGSAGNGFEPTANLAVTYGEFVPWGTAKFSMYATYTPTVASSTPTQTPISTLVPITTPTPTPVATPTPAPTPTPTPTGSQSSNLPSGLALKHQTNFETVTKASSTSLNMGIPNYFQFEGSGGASMWVEGLDRITPGITARSGTRCLGMEVTNIALSRRAEFNIYSSAVGLGNRFYISEYIYLPSSFTVTPGGYFDIFQVASDTSHACPMYSLMISGRNSDGTFNMMLFVRDANANKVGNDGIVASTSHFTLPRGQWFHFEYYQVNSSNGVVKAWINGQQVISYSGNTQLIGNYFLSTDLYYNADDTSVHRMWVDDLAIYG